jgi:ferritin-like metal-binding protein YciE/general stress protein YciG
MDLNSLFMEELGDLLHAEKQIAKALPRFARATTSSSLRDTWNQEIALTRDQVSRLEEVFGELEKPARAKSCPGMQGILTEGMKLLRQDGHATTSKTRSKKSRRNRPQNHGHENGHAASQSGLEAGLIACMQKAIHYRMASHGTLAAWAEALNEPSAHRLLRENLHTDESDDRQLSRIAERLVNPAATSGETAGADTEDRKVRQRDNATDESEVRGMPRNQYWDDEERGRGRRSDDRERDDSGRFVSEGRGSRSDDDDRYERSGSSRSRREDRERDESGRFVSEGRGSRSDDDDRYERSGSSRSRREDRERDESGRFVSEGRGSYSDDDVRYERSGSSRSRRGFAAMDPEERREIASMGGRARWGYDDDDDDRERRSSSSRRGREEDDEYRSSGRFSSRGRDEEDDGRSRSSSGQGRRGFAAMDPEERREIASMGGRARWGYDDDDDDRERRSSSSRRNREEDGDDRYERSGSSRSQRGFAAMDPEERREIASMGGRARWGYDDDDDRERRSSSSRRSREDDDDDRSRSYSSWRRRDDEDDGRSRSSSGHSRRGFAAMDPEQRRRIAAMGGRASHQHQH